MADNLAISPARIWTMRGLYVCISLGVLLLELLPLQTEPRRLAGPDLTLLLTFTFALRRPEFVPAWTIGLVILLGDLLLHGADGADLRSPSITFRRLADPSLFGGMVNRGAGDNRHPDRLSNFAGDFRNPAGPVAVVLVAGGQHHRRLSRHRVGQRRPVWTSACRSGRS